MDSFIKLSCSLYFSFPRLRLHTLRAADIPTAPTSDAATPPPGIESVFDNFSRKSMILSSL